MFADFILFFVSIQLLCLCVCILLTWNTGEPISMLWAKESTFMHWTLTYFNIYLHHRRAIIMCVCWYQIACTVPYTFHIVIPFLKHVLVPGDSTNIYSNFYSPFSIFLCVCVWRVYVVCPYCMYGHKININISNKIVII